MLGFQQEPYRILSKLSYGTIFCHRVSKVSELFSKINFSNDFGFFTVERYMLIVLGKIAKLVLRRLEAFVKYEDFFREFFLLETGYHLLGERDITLMGVIQVSERS